jgi:thioesterase domain-containing protein
MLRQIQKRPKGSAAIPLFLFHDASGTISSYYALGPIGRDVYAIADARMESDEPESMQDMGRRHYAAIKAVVPKGRIMLGGT